MKGVNEMADKIKEWLQNELDKKSTNKYIKEGWFDNDIINLFDNDNLIQCIKDCSSPYSDDLDKKLKLIFKAFSLFKPSETRVLILGQDPYPDDDEYRIKHYGKRAHGLAFSFNNGEEPADDSLLNIFKAIDKYKNPNIISDIYAWNTNLEVWAKNKGVLLLNTALTFEKSLIYDNQNNLSKKQKDEIKKDQDRKQRLHMNNWKPFIQQIITKLLTRDNGNLVIFLWGKKAQNSFLGCLNSNKEYEKINEISNKIKEIMNDSIMLNKRNNNFNKQKTIKRQEPIKIDSKIEIYMTSHPSLISENNDGRFIEYSPKHFEDCDKFLFGEKENEYIWKNFPENNS